MQKNKYIFIHDSQVTQLSYLLVLGSNSTETEFQISRPPTFEL